MTMGCRVSVLLPLLLQIHAALPPGYDEELYCPPGACLQRRERPQGWSGPRSDFYQCAHPPSTGATPTHPHSWGVKVGDEVKAALVAAGWHTTVCDDETPRPSVPHATGPAQVGLMAEALLSRAMRVHALLDI